MPRKCPKCAAVWDTPLTKCAFCGIEGEEQAVPKSVGKLLDSATAAKEPTADVPSSPSEPSILVAPPPEPAPVQPDPPPPVVQEAPVPPPPIPEALPANPLTKASGGFVNEVDRPAPKPTRRFVAPRPPAPLLPSATVPLVCSLVGLASLGILPAAVMGDAGRVQGILLGLSASLLLPFAPLGWCAGRHYEDRCAALGFTPAAAGRWGAWLGRAATLLLALEGSVLVFMMTLRRF